MLYFPSFAPHTRRSPNFSKATLREGRSTQITKQSMRTILSRSMRSHVRSCSLRCFTVSNEQGLMGRNSSTFGAASTISENCVIFCETLRTYESIMFTRSSITNDPISVVGQDISNTPALHASNMAPNVCFCFGTESTDSRTPCLSNMLS